MAFYNWKFVEKVEDGPRMYVFNTYRRDGSVASGHYISERQIASTSTSFMNLGYRHLVSGS